MRINVAGSLHSSKLQHTGLLWPSQHTARLCSRELAHCRSLSRRKAVVRAAADQEQVIVAALGKCSCTAVKPAIDSSGSCTTAAAPVPGLRPASCASLSCSNVTDNFHANNLN
jgi:hypothetical protein